MTRLFWQYSISGDRAAHAARGVGPATDYETPMRTPIHAPFAGTVARHDNEDGGFGLRMTGEKYIYVGQHLDARVSTGRRGHRAVVGFSGNTGKSSGPHHHAYIVIRATGQRISFSEWLRDYVNGPSSAPKPAASTRSLVGRTLNLGSKHWYWYRTAANAQTFREKQGKRGGQTMLTGAYTILAVASNGAIKVKSNHNGIVWLHSSAANHVK